MFTLNSPNHISPSPGLSERGAGLFAPNDGAAGSPCSQSVQRIDTKPALPFGMTEGVPSFLRSFAVRLQEISVRPSHAAALPNTPRKTANYGSSRTRWRGKTQLRPRPSSPPLAPSFAPCGLT